MLERITSRELTEWLAYYRLEEEERRNAKREGGGNG